MRNEGTEEGNEETLVETGTGSAESNPVLALGAKVARFVILSVIGEGGTSRVYAAFDPELDRKIALKLRKAGSGLDDARVRREAQALAKLTHPNVVTVYDVGEHEGQIYVAMEYVAGETLRAWAQRRPAWRAIVDAFVAAGQGLIAVHEAGLVHRDVKPDNIMRGADGRVRLMDFGLARERVEPTPLADEPVTIESRSTTLTRTGTLAGTPAYMAPEQHLGEVVDARTDQFALCVSLWELLYGERPFAGTNLAALTYNVTTGTRRAPSQGERGIPAWVRRAVERGLAVDPAQRHPDVAALLDALVRDPAQRARQATWLGLGLLGALGLGLVGAWWSRGSSEPGPAPPCAEVERFDAVWDPTRSGAALAEAFARTDSPLAESSARRASAGLDAWARAWNEARRDACEATHVRHEQSTTRMDSRIACLDRRRARVAGIVAAFMQPDAELVREAPTIVAKLEALDACADADQLLARAPPTDPATAAHVAELALRIESLAARNDIGRDVLVEARALAREAEATGYAPLSIDALLLLADAEELEAAPDSLATTRAAFHLALGNDLLAQAAVASIELMFRTWLVDPTSPTLAIWSEHAEVLVARIEPEGRLDARRRINLGVIAWSGGDLPGAIEHTRAAIAIAERTLGPRSVLVADYHNNLGYMLLQLGEEHEAQTEFEFTHAVWAETLGPEHPRLGVAELNLAEIAIEQGRLADARRLADTVLRRYEAAGETHGPNLSYALVLAADLDRRAGSFAAARVGFERARELSRAELGEDHWRTARARLGLGELALQSGELDEALEHFDAAARVFAPLAGNAREHGRALVGLARVEAAKGQVSRAREHAQRARERFVELGRRGDRDRLALDAWLLELAAQPGASR